MIRSFRLRLTAWYLALFSLLFLLFSVFVYGILAQGLQHRLDESLSSGANTAVGLFQAELAEWKGNAPEAAAETVSEMHLRGILLAVFEGQRLLAVSAPAEAHTLPAVATQALMSAEPELLIPMPHSGRNGARAATHRFEIGGRRYLVLAVESLDPIVADLRTVRRVLCLALPLVLALAGLGGFALASRSLAPARMDGRASQENHGQQPQDAH